MMSKKTEVSDRIKPILMKYWGWNEDMWKLWQGSPLHKDIDLIAEKIEEKTRQEEKQRLLEYINNLIKNSYEYIDEHNGDPHNSEIIRKYGLIDGFGELRKKLSKELKNDEGI